MYVCKFNLQQQKNLEGYVGFANLPNQVYRKSVKRGFEFTLMVVGEYICIHLCLVVYMFQPNKIMSQKGLGLLCHIILYDYATLTAANRKSACGSSNNLCSCCSPQTRAGPYDL